jgi:hypothetical protein
VRRENVAQIDAPMLAETRLLLHNYYGESNRQLQQQFGIEF